MTHISEALKKEHPEKKEYLQNELKSLGIVEPDHLHNEPNHKVGEKKEELQALAESIKSAYYEAYKTAYSSSSSNANNNSSGSRLANSQTPEKRE
jgi:uncharacterized protein YcbK (DUF882 family)